MAVKEFSLFCTLFTITLSKLGYTLSWSNDKKLIL